MSEELIVKVKQMIIDSLAHRGDVNRRNRD